MKIVKSIVYSVIIFSVWIGISAFVTGNTVNGKMSSIDNCNMTNTSFQGGERLVYKLYYNWKFVWIPAGEVVFTVQESNDTYTFKAVGNTYQSYESVFKVNDYFYSEVDKQTLFPRNFVRIIEEGNYTLYDSIAFNQNNNKAVSYHGRTKESAKYEEHKLNQCMQDLVSNMYYMRNFNTDGLKRGDQLRVKMFFDKQIFPINVRYDGKEDKEVKGLGDFKAIKLIPDLVEGSVFKKGDHMTMWVSDDKNRIPLLIQSPVSVGSIKAVLKSYSGLKHNLEAQIND